MSMDAIQAFLERAVTDETVQAELIAAASGLDGREAAAAVVGVGAAHGFDFTADEALQVRSHLLALELGPDSDGELGEAELEAVAGGNVRKAATRVARRVGRLVRRTGRAAGRTVGRAAGTAAGTAARTATRTADAVGRMLGGW